MAGFRIEGNTSGSVAEVDSTNNLRTNLPYGTPAGVDVGGGVDVAGFATMLSESDQGTIIGTRRTFAPEVTADYRLRTGSDTTIFNEYFPGTVLNSSIWTAPVTTSTVTVTNGLLNINAAASLVVAAVARVTTYRSFPIYTSYSTAPTMQVQFSAVPVAKMVHEWGFIIHTGVTAPTDGAFFRITAAGEFLCVLNNAGLEVLSTPLDYNALIGINTTRSFLIYANTAEVVFWIDNICVATIPRPVAAGSVTQSQMLPVSFRSYNTATVTGTAQIMKVGAVNVTLADMNQSKAWAHVMAGAGGMSYQGQTGQTLGSTALYPNNLGPGAGFALSNTSASQLGLGGQFSVSPVFPINNDGILTSYQIPTGTSFAPGKSLYVTGLSIQGVVTTALVGNSLPIIYAYSLAFGHNAISLTTTTTANTKAPVRKVLGIQTYAAAATVGTLGQEINKDFDRAPVVVQPGEFIQVVAKNFGAATASGTIAFLVDIEGYWE